MSETPLLLRSKGDVDWQQPEVTAYANEKGLQQIIADTPQLLPGVGPAATVTELYLSGTGSVDVVAVEPDGTVTLVECKLRVNPEIRRAVVGQILAYAGAAWQLSYEQFDDQWKTRSGESLHVDVSDVAGGADWDATAFRDAVAGRLEAGELRLVVVVDQVTEELKRVIEFLNTHTVAGVEVLALELGHIAHGDLEILLPSTYGRETAKVKGAGASTNPKWTVADVFAQLAELSSPVAVTAIRGLYEAVLAKGGKVYPGRGSYPTMSAYLKLGDSARAIWAVLADPTGGGAPRLQVGIGSWSKALSDDELEAVYQRLESVPTLAPAIAKARTTGANTYPTVPINDALAESGALTVLLEALEAYIDS